MSNPDAFGDRLALDPGLTALALLYTNGELEADEAGAFETRLGVDQAAREALCQAVQLTLSLGGLAPPTPHFSYRERVREQLLPNSAAGDTPALAGLESKDD